MPIKWSGKLKGFRFDPDRKAGTDFIVKSVEFLVDEKTVSRNVIVDGDTFELEFSPKKNDPGELFDWSRIIPGL